jgi:hypothetical protein
VVFARNKLLAAVGGSITKTKAICRKKKVLAPVRPDQTNGVKILMLKPKIEEVAASA